MSENPGEESAPIISDANAVSPEKLAREEKKASRRVDLDGYQGLLVGALLLYVLSLFLPVTPGARGYGVLLFTLTSQQDTGATLAEFIHAVLIFLSVGLLNVLVLLTRRTVFCWAAWILSGIGVVYSVFALWMRQTQDTDNVSGIGMYVSVAAVILACYALSCVSLRRDPEQKRLAEARASQDNLDEVGRAQRAATATRRDSNEDNPLLQDDRRSEAAERHRKRRGSTTGSTAAAGEEAAPQQDDPPQFRDDATSTS